MKLEMSEALEAYNALRVLGRYEMPAVVGIRLGRLRRELEGYQEDYDEARLDVMRQYAELETDDDGETRTDDEGRPLVQTDEEGSAVFPDDEAEQGFQNEMEEALEEEVEIQNAPISESTLEKCGDVPFDIIEAILPLVD